MSDNSLLLFIQNSEYISMETGNQTRELFLYQEMKRGKSYAFDFFFNYYYPGLCVYAQKLNPVSEQESKDLVQDVFVKFWNDREKTEILFSIRSYLFVSVKNKCFDLHRKKNTNFKVQEITKDLDITDESFDTYVLSELESLFDKSLEKLPERCREIFELSRLQGLKNREIAAKLNLSEKTVENQMTKALHILKEELRDYLPMLVLFEFFDFLR